MGSAGSLLVALFGLPIDLGGGAPEPTALRIPAELELETSGPVIFQVAETGGIHYLFAERIAPRCPRASNGVFDLSAADAAVRCFFREYAPLFDDHGENSTGVAWTITDVGPPDLDGLQIIRLRQMYGDVPVETGEVAFTGHLGELRSFLGRLEPPSRVPQPPAGGPNETEATIAQRAEQTIGEPLRLERRVYSPDVQEIVSVFRNAADELISFGERSGLELERRLDVARLNLVPKSTSVENYNAFDRIGLFGSNPQPVTVNVDMQGSDACLDHGSDLQDGEARICYAGNNSECTDLYCEPGSGNPVYVGYPNTMAGKLMNVHFWMHDLAVFANVSLGEYDFYTHWPASARDDLSVGVTTSNAGACGGSGCVKINPLRMMLKGADSSAQELEVMAHEYGHVIQALYGTWSGPGFLQSALTEGFADHNTLRYGMYRLRNFATRPWDTAYAFPPAYSDLYWNLYNSPGTPYIIDHRITPFYQNGQAYPQPISPLVPESEWPMLIYQSANSPCFTQNLGNKDHYQCGSVLGVVYWTLSWNQIRVPYVGRALGTPILTTSAYTSTPERLASRAYTFAIAGLPTNGSATPADFFARVSEQYWNFRSWGTISPAEYDNVAAALAVHCVGWSSGTCTQYHKTLWHPLPVVWVDQQTFAMGIQPGASTIRHFARAEDTAKVSRYGSPTAMSFGTTDGLGYMRLDTADDFLCVGTNFPSAGNYKLSISYKESVAGPATIKFSIANSILGPYQDWVLPESNGSWNWAQGYSPAVSVTAGNRYACVQHKNQVVNIDAILIIKE